MQVTIRLFLGVASFALLLTAVRLHVLVMDTRSWSTTLGELDSRGLFNYGNGSDGGVGVMGDTSVYARYSYQVAGKQYVGSRVKVWDMPLTKPGITPGSLDPSRAAGLVTVSYNPSDPRESILDPGYPVAPLAMLLLGGLLSGSGALFANSLSRGFTTWLLRRES